MTMEHMGPVKLTAATERWPLATPFKISGYTFEHIDVLVVTLEKEGRLGSGEAAGVYYKNDKPETMLAQIEALRGRIEDGVSRASVQRLMPPGGARNALDCAVWDLEAQLTGRAAWDLAGLASPKPVLTTFTCGADSPERMAAVALGYPNPRAIKLKLTGEPVDADRIRAVREALPDVWLGVDANQGFTRPSLEGLMPELERSKVALIEQPFRIGQDALLDGFQSPIPIAADESMQCLSDIPGLAGRYAVGNIKLDKCGGLTEALAMAHMLQDHGLDAMVGNMIGTSLAMAPGFLVAQLCKIADLDGPLFLSEDRQPSARYADGLLTCPDTLWGGARR